MAVEHKDAAIEKRHAAHNWEYADAAARAAATGMVPGDVGKLARQLDDNTLWMLTDDSPVTWVSVTGSAGASLTDFKDSVRAATTANITLSAAQTIDGVSVIAGDRVLVKDQSSGADNGIYVCAAGSWTRATDFDASAEVTGGCLIPVSEGTANGNKLFMLTTNDPITLGSTALVFAAFTTSAAAAWSALTDPAGNLSLAMGAHLTTFTWAGNFGSFSAWKFQGNNTSPTGPLVDINTATGNNSQPLLVGARGGQSLKVTELGNLVLGAPSPINSATAGFPYFPVIQSNAEPTGTPTSITGAAPLVLESDAVQGEYRLWAYMGSAWRLLTPVGGMYAAQSGSGAQTIDWSTSRESIASRQITMTGNVTLTFTAPARAGTICVLVTKQDATGGRTITWPASILWPGGSDGVPTPGANTQDSWTFMWNGTNYVYVVNASDLS